MPLTRMYRESQHSHVEQQIDTFIGIRDIKLYYKVVHAVTGKLEHFICSALVNLDRSRLLNTFSIVLSFAHQSRFLAESCSSFAMSTIKLLKRLEKTISKEVLSSLIAFFVQTYTCLRY